MSANSVCVPGHEGRRFSSGASRSVTRQGSPPMHEGSMAIWVIGVVELLLLASLSAVVLRRVRFPYTIGLVIVGILLAVAQDRLHVLSPSSISG